jgi:hypothetical protein
MWWEIVAKRGLDILFGIKIRITYSYPISHVMSFLRSNFIIIRYFYLPLPILYWLHVAILNYLINILQLSPLGIFELCRHSNYSVTTEAGSVYIEIIIASRDEIDQTRYPLQKMNMKDMLCLGWTFTNCEVITKCQFVPKCVRKASKTVWTL